MKSRILQIIPGLAIAVALMPAFSGCNGGSNIYIEPPSPGDAKRWSKVWEYSPAPGQFIGDPLAGFGNVKSPADARRYATDRLSKNFYVSLGGFGGYIVVGFEHGIENLGGRGEYDFSIRGNQSSASSEPGIVWVSRDENGDGIPNDEWYELRGSETDKQGTRRNYEVTYHRPSASKMAVEWTDSEGASGTIDYRGEFHSQDYYYPAWIAEESYTLRGTCLDYNIQSDHSTGMWQGDTFDWGYVDNAGGDIPPDVSSDERGKIFFKISNAMNPDGTPALLPSIDFIKVQTGVNAKAGWLGEISTEVLDFRDENP